MIINGKQLADWHISEMKEQITSSENRSAPRLVVVLVGDRADSASYVKMKQQTAATIGITVDVMRFDSHVTQDTLKLAIQRTALRLVECDGMIIQLPLPPHLNAKELIELIPPYLDVDGLTDANLGFLTTGRSLSQMDRLQDLRHVPCTPAAVLDIISSVTANTTNSDNNQATLEGKHVVLIGCGELVGKPLAIQLINRHATVTCCNKHTHNISELTRQGDIVVAAAGVPRLVQRDWIKPGAIVIDVGITSVVDETGKRKLFGDVDFDNVKEVASAVTPVPGGVGPMTVVMLMRAVMKTWLAKQDFYL